VSDCFVSAIVIACFVSGKMNFFVIVIVVGIQAVIEVARLDCDER